jgi:hypothetical protein
VVKRSGRGVNHPPPSSAEVKERVDIYFYFLCVFKACSRVKFINALRFNFRTLPFCKLRLSLLSEMNSCYGCKKELCVLLPFCSFLCLIKRNFSKKKFLHIRLRYYIHTNMSDIHVQSWHWKLIELDRYFFFLMLRVWNIPSHQVSNLSSSNRMRDSIIQYPIYSIPDTSYFIHSKGNVWMLFFFTCVCFVGLVSNLLLTVFMKLCVKRETRLSGKKWRRQKFRHLNLLLLRA